MQVSDLLTPDRVIPHLRVGDKRRLLDDLARRAAGSAQLDAKAVLDALEDRERLGSTGMGSGIAIPHARFQALREPIGFFASLRPPVDFDAIDEQRVDLVFLLLLPSVEQGEQLNALACVARRLRGERVATALRKTHDAPGLYTILTAPPGSSPSA